MAGCQQFHLGLDCFSFYVHVLYIDALLNSLCSVSLTLAHPLYRRSGLLEAFFMTKKKVSGRLQCGQKWSANVKLMLNNIAPTKYRCWEHHGSVEVIWSQIKLMMNSTDKILKNQLLLLDQLPKKSMSFYDVEKASAFITGLFAIKTDECHWYCKMEWTFSYWYQILKGCMSLHEILATNFNVCRRQNDKPSAMELRSTTLYVEQLDK